MNYGTITKDLTFMPSEKDGGAKKVLKEIVAENSPNFAKDINLQIQEADWMLNKINPNKSTSQYIVVKFMATKYKD